MAMEIDMIYANKELAKTYVQFRPLPPKDLISRIIEFRKEKLVDYSNGDKTSLKFCLDIGCGSGQATELFADHFEHVIGVDVSPAQLEIACQRNAFENVSYMLGSAENLIAQDASVDLVSTSTSVHWFDLQKFYKEVDRVLKPGGVLACFSYRPAIPFFADKSLWKEMEEIWDSLDPYRPEGFDIMRKEYETLPHIYPDYINATGFSAEYNGTLETFLGYPTAWSSYWKMKEAEGEEASKDFLRKSKQRLLSAMDTDLVDPPMKWRFDFYLRLYRKPTSEINNNNNVVSRHKESRCNLFKLHDGAIEHHLSWGKNYFGQQKQDQDDKSNEL